MDLCDKKAWLDKHGELSYTFVNTSESHFTKHWKTRNGTVISETCGDKESMYSNLFDKVKDTLYYMCEYDEH